MKKRAAFTLVEVMVASFIFLLVLLATLGTCLLAANQVERQRRYLFFEEVCLEIDAYSDKYGREWNEKYFGNTAAEQYYSADKVWQSGSEGAKFRLTFEYRDTDENGKDELIVTVSEVGGGKIIDGLNYGDARYVE